jgi:hypothetical protein
MLRREAGMNKKLIINLPMNPTWLGRFQPVPSVKQMEENLAMYALETLALNKPAHTEQDVQRILEVATKGQIGEMSEIERVVRDVLGVKL